MQLVQIIFALIFGLYGSQQGSQQGLSVMLMERVMLIGSRGYEVVESARSVSSVGEMHFGARAGYKIPSEPFPIHACAPKPRDPWPPDGDRRSESATWGQIKGMFASNGSSGTITNDFNSQSDYGSGGNGGSGGSGGSGGTGGGSGGNGGGGSGGGNGR